MGTGETEPEEHEVPGLKSREDLPEGRKQIASYIPAENDSPASSQSRTASSAGVACAAARSSTLSCIMSFLSVGGAAAQACAGPAADDDGGEAGGGAEGVPRAGYVGQCADDR